MRTGIRRDGSGPRRAPARVAGILGSTALVLLAACGRQAAPPASPTEVRALPVTGELPKADPDSSLWRKAPEHVAQLLVQDQTEPKLLQPSVPVVRVRALTDGKWVVFRLEWDDATRDLVADAGRFGDAAAVQFPTGAGGDVPDAAMGQMGRQVRIHLWKAAWQERVEGRGDAIATLYPNAHPDHYPYQAASDKDRAAMETLYAPARGAGNPVTVGRADSPTQDLVAEGFGTLTALPEQVSLGKGVHDGKIWKVTIARPLDAGQGEALRPGTATYAAFAVWDGASGNVGARKMRSGWIPLRVEVGP